MIRLSFRSSVVALGLVILAATGLLPFLEAQPQPLQPPPGEEALLGGLGDKLLPKESSRLGDLRYGKKPVNDANPKETEENKLVLTKAARYYAYRLTNPIFLEKEKNPEGLTMNDLVNQSYDKMLLNPEIRSRRGVKDEQKEYLKQFSKEMIGCLREVLTKNGKPIVRVNAVRMLAGLAEAGQEDVADTLREIIQNPSENDGVKLHAFRAFKELFELGGPDKSIFQNAAREADCIKAIADYVHRPRPTTLPVDAAAEEKGAYQYVRREAIRALSATRFPIAPKSKPGDGLTARYLERALKKQLDPDTSLTEQAEAAIGLCHLQAKLSKEYSLDFVAADVGRFGVEFIGDYGNQRATKQTLIPWKLYTVRLGLALETLNSQAKDPAQKSAAGYVAKVVELTQKALRPLEVDKDTDAEALNALDTFLRGNPPASKELLKGVKEAVLKTGTP